MRPLIRQLGSGWLVCWLTLSLSTVVCGVEMRFTDARQEYRGERYLFLGDSPLQIVIPVAPQPNDVLEFYWGAKNDHRSALLTVNGKEVTLNHGGYDGFQWLKVPVPAGVSGTKYELELQPGPGGKPAFLAGVRLAGTEAAITYKTAAAKPPIVFPEMRAIWDREPATPASDERYRQAEKNARQAAEAFYRCRKFVDGWLAHADPKTGLIPRNLGEGKDYWNGRDSAADNYPFMVLTAAMTDRALFEGRMLDMLRTETKLTCRVDRLPDDYSFSKQGWRREKLNLDAIIFDGAEYVKDGLLPITEWLGPSPWSERAVGIIDDIWKNAPVETPFGRIPTLNFEVNGDLLQACSRLFWFTGDRKYLDWAIRLGDYYLLGDHHPTRDLKELKLGDHSCEVINGLSELYVACKYAAPEKKKAYEKPLHELYDRILAIACNEHGLIYLQVNTSTGQHSDALTDNWGYNYDGLYTAFLLDGTTTYRDAVRKALSNLKAHYTGKGGMCQSNTADGYSDSIEGAINLVNREPDASAADWIDTEIKTMWSKQKPDGVIEGWHGDGNSARTSLMYALWKTQGCRVEPWRPDVRVGAVRDGDKLFISLTADQPWKGKLLFDQPRHKTNMRLPLDYPRINQFPEWFTDTPGSKLAAGLPITLDPGKELHLEVTNE